MQRYYPHLKKVIPNDFLLNLINHHLNQILACHSKILAFRMDFDYQRGTNRFIRNSSIEIQDDLRELTQAMITLPGVIGSFWVLEWTSEGQFMLMLFFILMVRNIRNHFRSFYRQGNCGIRLLMAKVNTSDVSQRNIIRTTLTMLLNIATTKP